MAERYSEITMLKDIMIELIQLRVVTQDCKKYAKEIEKCTGIRYSINNMQATLGYAIDIKGIEGANENVEIFTKLVKDEKNEVFCNLDDLYYGESILLSLLGNIQELQYAIKKRKGVLN